MKAYIANIVNNKIADTTASWDNNDATWALIVEHKDSYKLLVEAVAEYMIDATITKITSVDGQLEVIEIASEDHFLVGIDKPSFFK